MRRPGSAAAGEAGGDRLLSLDALRGFDMFWIVGGSGLLAAAGERWDTPLLSWMNLQATHVEWHGFRLWDLIFPLFLFVAGVAMPFSLAKRARTTAPLGMHLFVLRRGLTLVFLGVVYNGLLALDFENLRYASVLGRIGLGWMFAALVFLHTGVRGQIAWAAGCLLAYAAALHWVPVPGFGPGSLAEGETLTDYVDRLLLPGRLHRGNGDPEGLLSTVPAVATALLGGLAGHWLRSSRREARKVLGLAGAGLGCLAAGGLWSLVLPLNKNLWTSSFTLWTAGLSLLLLAASYLVIDVWRLRRWAFFFVVIGTNAITIYMLEAFVRWEVLVHLVLDERRLHPVVLASAGIGLRWLVLYVLYRRRIFLRV
jgi:predicted acyltransferase